MNARRPRHLVPASGNITALDGRLFWRPIKACFRLFGRKKGPFTKMTWEHGSFRGLKIDWGGSESESVQGM